MNYKCKWPTLKIILYMEIIWNLLFKMFPTLILNEFFGPYNLIYQDLFPGMTKNGFLTFIYILICMYVCCPFNFFLSDSLLCGSLSGENHLIIHDGADLFTPIRILPWQTKKMFFTI